MQSDFTLGKTPWPMFVHIDSYQICVDICQYVCVCVGVSSVFKNSLYICTYQLLMVRVPFAMRKIDQGTFKKRSRADPELVRAAASQVSINSW